jgi:hypothetical protein
MHQPSRQMAAVKFEQTNAGQDGPLPAFPSNILFMGRHSCDHRAHGRALDIYLLSACARRNAK